MTVADRFSSKTRRVGDCVIWTASQSAPGYGSFYYDGRWVRANRAAWMIYKGPMPTGMLVLHKCRNSLCVNVEHLYIGTRWDNARDKLRDGTYKNPNPRVGATHCKHGHAMTPENTKLGKTGKGHTHRYCVICKRESERRRVRVYARTEAKP